MVGMITQANAGLTVVEVEGHPDWWNILQGGKFIGLHIGTKEKALAKGREIIAKFGDVWGIEQ